MSSSSKRKSPAPDDRNGKAWQEKVSQHGIDGKMFNRLTRLFREELWDVMENHMELKYSISDINERAMTEHCRRFSALLLQCLHDDTRRDPFPNTWEELEQRIEEARYSRLPALLKEEGIEVPSEEALRALQALFHDVAESAMNRAKFDKEKNDKGQYLLMAVSQPRFCLKKAFSRAPHSCSITPPMTSGTW